MKNLKYFESVDDYSEWSIDPQDIKEMFFDISDLGWIVRATPSKRLRKVSSEVNLVEFNFQHYIRLVILKPFTSTERETIKQELTKLINSQIFEETIKQAEIRLQDYGYYISPTWKNTKIQQYIEIEIIKKETV
jgi:hypothetical protein